MFFCFAERWTMGGEVRRKLALDEFGNTDKKRAATI